VAHRRAEQESAPDKLAKLRDEIGDVMIYLTELAEKLDIDPVEAAKAKVASPIGESSPRSGRPTPTVCARLRITIPTGTRSGSAAPQSDQNSLP